MQKKKWCAPGKNNDGISCYSIDSLKKLACACNERKIGNKRIKINNRKKKQLWEDIRLAMSEKCNNEICWAEQDVVREMGNKEILKETFRPKMPAEWKKDMTTWLNTNNIRNVMKQYEKKYPDFLFIGPVPLDCGVDKSLYCELTNFDINKLYKKGIRRVGIIVNTGISTSDGEHWYAFFIDLNKKLISFYDSYGEAPYKETYSIMKKIKDDFKKSHNIDLKIEWNKVRSQRDAYNCGAYSMFFIIKKLESKTMAQINRMKLDTAKMQKCKTEWYRN